MLIAPTQKSNKGRDANNTDVSTCAVETKLKPPITNVNERTVPSQARVMFVLKTSIDTAPLSAANASNLKVSI